MAEKYVFSLLGQGNRIMKRIPEPDLMDDREQAEAYASTDFSEPHNAFIIYFKKLFPDFNEGEVLDLGCGTADVTIRFAHAFPNTRLTGIDGAQAMLDLGRKAINAKGLSGRITLHKRLIPDKELFSMKFDAVISNSLLHHLNDPSALWDTITQCIKRGKPVFIMDLFRPDSAEIARKLVDIHADGATEILKKDFYNSLLSAYNIKDIHQQLKKSNLQSLNVDTMSDRHMIIWGNYE